MTTIQSIKIVKAKEDQRQSIISLLQSENLPTEDLPGSLDNFLVALEGDEVVAAIGLEQLANCGLLRSMVVNKEHRNRSIASGLVKELESGALALGINCIYLLTETAPLYFERKGYKTVTRDETPEAIKASSEFKNVCPVSAIVMKKNLN
ncbi:MAG: GNAT family N-acetyltransferase [Bacteroidota bacterium]|nr:GNAT family N-acetyltransferase [Bacteroidota bacterium]